MSNVCRQQFPASILPLAFDNVQKSTRELLLLNGSGAQCEHVVFPINRVIGLTSNNVREIRGHSVRFGVDLTRCPPGTVLRPGVYVVSIVHQSSNSIHHLGVAAVPELDTGINRCECVLFDAVSNPVKSSTAPGTSGPKECERYCLTEAQLGTLFGDNAHGEEQHGGSNMSIVFVRKVDDFSHTGIGPWLRDLILLNVEKLNTDFGATDFSRSFMMSTSGGNQGGGDKTCTMTRPLFCTVAEDSEASPRVPLNENDRTPDIEYLQQTGGLGSIALHPAGALDDLE